MTHRPKRRWLRFSLRTLFVAITLLACVMGYEMNWIQQRRNVVNNPNIFSQPFYVKRVKLTAVNGKRVWDFQQFDSVAPWPLNWLGEQGYWLINFKDGTSADELVRVRRLFPESEFVTSGKPMAPGSAQIFSGSTQ